MTGSGLPSDARRGRGGDTTDVAGGVSFSCSACGFEGRAADVTALLARQREHREQYGESHVLEFDR